MEQELSDEEMEQEISEETVCLELENIFENLEKIDLDYEDIY